MEDYLKAIYQLTLKGEKVSTSELAVALECTAASVTSMLQKLSEMKLVQYAPYQGVSLTSSGKKIALEVIRHHRLIELYLAEMLGYSWDKVHAEAEKLEHVISEEFEEKIDQALGFPTQDPHGDPIPSKEGMVEHESLSLLWDAPIGRKATIRRVSDRDPEVLRYLATIGIYPNVTVELVRKGPFGGPLHLRVGPMDHTISEALARQIHVSVE
ncbi:MAG: metal-dependent transcriptional regulator [Acidobacteria bacterium]|nr:metal-dependent transcriptional regulator [Acidobacteriota bacterium]